MSADTDDRIAELERKLAEQQAALFTIRTIVAGCDSDEATRIIRHLQKHFDNQHTELDNLLAKAKEEGRREAVPESLIDAVCLKASEIHRLGEYVSDNTAQLAIDEIRAMLSSAPKPQGETSCQ